MRLAGHFHLRPSELLHMEECMKKISVIIPCYNVSPYIDRCMASVMNQTIGRSTLEIICIDDASADNTWECLQKWEKQFPNDIVLIRQDMNRRQGAARNLGLQYAAADWVSFVDADDWLEPDYFEILYEPVIRYNCDVSACGFIRDASYSDSRLDKRAGGAVYCSEFERKEADAAQRQISVAGSMG